MNSLTDRVAQALTELGTLSPAGYAIAFDINMSTPSYLFQTYPEAWLNEYSARGYMVKDPTVAWGVANIGHCRWSALAAPGAGVSIFDAAADHGMKFGVALAFERNDRRSIASFTRSDREFTDAEISEIDEKLSALHALLSGEGEPDMNEIRGIRAISVALSH